jgi:hypothetical protein
MKKEKRIPHFVSFGLTTWQIPQFVRNEKKFGMTKRSGCGWEASDAREESIKKTTIPPDPGITRSGGSCV